MTKKDLFKIILKLYGLYCLIDLLIQLPNIIYMLYFDSNSGYEWLTILIPVISILTIYILLFFPEFFIRIFKLDKGFDNNESIKNSLNDQEIIKIGLIIIGVFLFVSNIGDFITEIVFSFKNSVSRSGLDSLLESFNPNLTNYKVMISSGLYITFGFLLLTNYKRIASWLEKMNDKNVRQ